MQLNIVHIFIFLVIFLFIFPRDNFIKVEPYIIWKIDKENIKNYKYDKFYFSRIGKLKKLFLRNENKLAFFDNNGKIVKSYMLADKCLISSGTGEKGVVCYFKDKDSIYFLHRMQGIIWNYKTFAYPSLSLNNKWVILFTGENGGYFVINSTTGNRLSEFIASGSLILSYSVAYYTNLIAMGYVNGMVSLYNTKLDLLWSKSFTDSEIPIIKKVSISPDGKYISVLAGLNKEHLYLLDNNGKIVLDYITGEERRRPVELLFSMNSKFLIEESENGFRIYSIKKRKLLFEKKLFEKSVERKIVSIDISPNGKFILIAYKQSNNISIIELYSNTGTMFFRLFFEKQLPLVLFSFDKNSFLIETNNKIFVYGF